MGMRRYAHVQLTAIFGDQMNTLSRATTAQFFTDIDAFRHFQHIWRALARANSTALRAEHHMLYAMLRGRDWRKGFAIPVNPNKVLNGALCMWSMRTAFAIIEFAGRDDHAATDVLAVFEGTLTNESLHALHQVLPSYRALTCNPADWRAGYPFDAYCANPTTEVHDA
jgi:hypothetical protein